MKTLFFFLTLISFFLVACGGAPAKEIPPAATTQPPPPPATNTSPPPPTNTPLPTDTPPPPTDTASPYLFQDEFDGKLGEGWQWIGEDPAKWSLTQAPGSIRLMVQPTNINQGEPKNFLLREAPAGNFELGTLVRFTPTSNYQFAGLMVYQSQGNAMQFGRAFATCDNTTVCPGNAIYFDFFEAGQFMAPNFATMVQNQSQAFLRLRREGNSYSGYYSEDGINWVFIGKHDGTSFTPQFVGLIASQAYNGETTADFEYFTIEAIP